MFGDTFQPVVTRSNDDSKIGSHNGNNPFGYVVPFAPAQEGLLRIFLILVIASIVSRPFRALAYWPLVFPWSAYADASFRSLG